MDIGSCQWRPNDTVYIAEAKWIRLFTATKYDFSTLIPNYRVAQREKRAKENYKWSYYIHVMIDAKQNNVYMITSYERIGEC